MSEQQRGFLFVLVGPGGTGKNTLMNAIMQQNPHITQLATATTRERRPNEKQGREHLFISEERFREMIANDELLEYQEVVPGKFYGIPRASVEDAITSGQHLIADIEVLGAKIVHDAYPDDVILVFITVPGDTLEERLDILRERMTNRDEEHATDADETKIQQRLERAKILEFPFAEQCEFLVINEDLATATTELESIIQQKLQSRQAATSE